MNKRVLLLSLLMVLPILAVGLATTGDSVMLFDTVTGETGYYSYFDILPVAKLSMLTPLAALLAAASGIAAAVYMVRKKNGVLKAAGYLALVSAGLAAIPNVLRDQVLVMPNVILPILMMLEYVVCYYLGKMTQAQKEPENPNRLSRRKP